MMRNGDLPFLSRLAQDGGYSSVKTTYPALTPAAWSTFATGTNPGGHGIFEFVHRDPAKYLPQLAMNRYEQKNAFLPPKAVNLRRGTPVWEVLSDAGVKSTIVRCPCTYPPDNTYGRMLAGVGVPDLRGGLGTSTFYSQAESLEEQESENVVTVSVDRNNTVSTHLIGPRNPRTGEDVTCDIKLSLDPSARKLVVHSDGQPRALGVREGQWSDWLKVKFKMGLLQSIRGMVRFFLVRQEPILELYASPINFDPESPLFPISSPPEYAAELAAKLGTFYTVGMAEDHSGLNNGRIDNSAYLQQCEMVLREREQMMLYELDRLDDGLFFCLFDTPDRLAHMFWRFDDIEAQPEGGDHDAAWHAIEQHYRACDAIVGKALEHVDDQSLMIVLSDHGMNSFRRGVNLNTWLYENDLLALKEGVTPGDLAGDFLRGVDWSRTRAYALGLGGIYLNLKDREGQGVVTLEEAESLKEGIARELTGLVDPKHGSSAVRGVVTREQVYHGPYAAEAPDLLVNFAPGYRVSWGTPLGGVPEGLFEDNLKKWTGDHAIDPVLVPGVLFMNRPINADQPSLVDLAPTILDALGVPPGAAMEGKVL
jgi:predicted AlkP superfamily phosphohydrolase/phosphomutase